jgi:cysteine-rich repeat protein
VPDEICDRGWLCDRETAACAKIAEGCERVEPGGAYCSGTTRVTCGADLVTKTEVECEGLCAEGVCAGVRCGDGIVQAQEECDDANAVDTDGCTNACRVVECGDGVVAVGREECDDGNGDDGDACPSTCAFAKCGDGFVQAGVEACDDGNLLDTDDCLRTCEVATCGDNVAHEANEACDDGNDKDGDACPTSCKLASCGDGFVWEGEEDCDDGGHADGDGCSRECRAEPVALSLGAAHSCALFGDGQLKCWGDNAYGQAGNTTDRAIGDEVSDLGVNLPALMWGVTSVGAGAYHTCAVQGQAVRCWGDNRYGQLGPDAEGTSSLVRVSVPVGPDPVSVCGTVHSSFVLLADGTVQGWGVNYDDETSRDVATAPFSGPAKSIGCGTAAVCAVLRSGAVECWGNSPLTSAKPVPLELPLEEYDSSGVVEVTHGASHACARYASGDVRCWGFGGNGQLCEASTANRPGTQDGEWWTVELHSTAASLSSGNGVSCVAGYAKRNGVVKCWGYDARNGALGVPELTWEATNHVCDEADDSGGALPEIDLGAELVGRVVATSGNHTCAILTNGRVKCWGDNRSGQLGLGTTDPSIGDEVGEMGDRLRYALLD